jgi:hypothetical protein
VPNSVRGGDVLVCVAVREGILVYPLGWRWRDVAGGADGEARELTAGKPPADPSTSAGSRCSNAPN